MSNNIFSIFSSNYNVTTRQSKYSSIDNTFIPLADWISSEEHYEGFSMYNTIANPLNIFFSRITNFIKLFTDCNVYASDGTYYRRKKSGSEREYIEYRRYYSSFWDENYNLLCFLAFNSRNIKSVEANLLLPYDEIDKSLFTVIVNTEIFKEEHKEFYRLFDKHILEEARQQGFDILFTKDIKGYCFNLAKIHIPLFEDIDAEQSYLKTITNLLYDETPEKRSITVYDESREELSEAVENSLGRGTGEENPTEELLRLADAIEAGTSSIPGATYTEEDGGRQWSIPRPDPANSTEALFRAAGVGITIPQSVSFSDLEERINTTPTELPQSLVEFLRPLQREFNRYSVRLENEIRNEDSPPIGREPFRLTPPNFEETLRRLREERDRIMEEDSTIRTNDIQPPQSSLPW